MRVAIGYLRLKGASLSFVIVVEVVQEVAAEKHGASPHHQLLQHTYAHYIKVALTTLIEMESGCEVVTSPPLN